MQATREVVHLLQRQLDVIQSEKVKLQQIVRTSEGAAEGEQSSTSDALLATISRLEQEAEESQAKIKSVQRMYDRLNNEYEKLEEEKKSLSEEISVLRDTVEAKDKTVINLTNEIFDLEANGQPSLLGSTTPPATGAVNRKNSMIKLESPEIDQLKDSVQAYSMQNEFLNQEVVAVNELRLMSERKAQELQLKAYEWEAKCCQMQSKLLSLLKEINQSISASRYEDEKDPQTRKKEVIVSDATIDLVSRLLEDISLNVPLSWQKGNRSRNEAPSIIAAAKFNHQEYDDLGFCHRNVNARKSFNGSANETDDGPDEADLIQEELAKRTKEIAGEAAAAEAQVSAPAAGAAVKQTWKSRWDSYVGCLAGSAELQRSQELKLLLRSGIPREYRCKVWKGLISLRVKATRERLPPDYYKRLLMQQSGGGSHSGSGTKVTGGKGTQTKSYDPHVKQIELDLLRTLPNNKHFESLESDGTCRLRRVLTAYSRHNPQVCLPSLTSLLSHASSPDDSSSFATTLVAGRLLSRLEPLGRSFPAVHA